MRSFDVFFVIYALETVEQTINMHYIWEAITHIMTSLEWVNIASVAMK